VSVRFKLFSLAALTLAFAATAHGQAMAASTATHRGSVLFEASGCAHCHGTAGVGGGRGPDLQQVRTRMNAAAIANQIHNGAKAMPAFGEELSDGQIHDLVVYLRAKRRLIKVPTKTAEAPALPNQEPQ
jgi:mono/diheme cytochrome c family protein